MKDKQENVPAGKFKAECLAMMDVVAEGTVEYVITKRGKPVAKLVPVGKPSKPVFGCMKGTAKAVGDLLAPVDVAWEAHEGA